MRETHVLMMAEKPVKISTFIEGGEGLGRAMTTVGRRKSAAWMKAVVGMLVRVVEEAESALLAGYVA
jgi:hypothetical protein